MRSIAMSDTRPLEDILETAAHEMDGRDGSVSDLLDIYDDRAFGPIFSLLGLLVVLPPLGAIPGLPMVVGVIIILFSAQLLLGRNHPWVPRFIGRLSVSGQKISTARKKSGKALAQIDNLIEQRIAWAISPVFRRVAAAIVLLLGALMIPMEMVPFAVALPGAGVTMIGISLVARDGLLMLVALTLSTGAFALSLVLLMG